ncbi:SiaB family protein kinase [Bernardetia sp.]|uniref:SiaB family protein kinase n=1 Tax=Bernardetia sp. TaxID=1937974 RepID=UPI0025BEB09E|nr:SiaB family protein kinase [Bernardetia sp.]
MVDYHNILNPQSAVLYYKGPFDREILANISSQLRRRFADNPRMSAKLFSIFIELAQNISYYSAESNFFYDDSKEKNILYGENDRVKNHGVGTVVIHSEGDEIILSAGNLVPTDKVQDIIIKCEKINSLSTEQLRELKKEVRSQERKTDHIGGNIGLIQVALKSEHPLHVQAKVIDDINSFFIISSTIEK